MELKLEALKIFLTLFYSWLLLGFLAGALSSLRKWISSSSVVGTVSLPQQWANKVIAFYQCAVFRQTLARLQQISWYWPKVITSWDMISVPGSSYVWNYPCIPWIKQLLRPRHELLWSQFSPPNGLRCPGMGQLMLGALKSLHCSHGLATSDPRDVPVGKWNGMKLCWCPAPHGPEEIRILEVNPHAKVTDTLWERTCSIRFAITSKILTIIFF